MRGSKGYHSGSRQLLTKPTREKGKPKLSKLLTEYAPGSQVIIKVDSSEQKTLPHKRFHGKIGTVIEKRGRGYMINVAQGNAFKKIILRAEHLQKYTGS
jgi:large subunit ribosomal protein L21e